MGMGVRLRAEGHVFESRDGGESWRQTAQAPLSAGAP
jgi:hypothetical protein